MKNQECKARLQVVNVNSNNPVFYPYSIKTSKCSGTCNNINYPYAKICVLDFIKYLNVKIFNLMSRINETRFIEWHEHVSVNVDQMQLLVIINNVRIKIHVDVNVNN